MKVILLQDIENLGKRYEVKEVKNGHGRNFLIPQGLVKIASKEALKWLETQREAEEKIAEEELKGIQEKASKLDGMEISIPVKIGEKGQLFESINSQRVSEKLKELGFEVKKSQIKLDEPIKELGEFPIKIGLEHNLEVEITIIVTEEKI